MTRIPPVRSAETIDSCKARIQGMYQENPHVRLNITLTHSKVVQDAEATIIGVYRHCFCVEEASCGVPQRHTFTYADLLTGRVEIAPNRP
ncbi:MAG: Veg family protein [Aristaeellaceae bacterium]